MYYSLKNECSGKKRWMKREAKLCIGGKTCPCSGAPQEHCRGWHRSPWEPSAVRRGGADALVAHPFPTGILQLEVLSLSPGLCLLKVQHCFCCLWPDRRLETRRWSLSIRLTTLPPCHQCLCEQRRGHFVLLFLKNPLPRVSGAE